MTNMIKDYYKILGVSDLCTEQELKSAYRKLARIWHPDIAGNTEEVVSKFKEINEAYEILSDEVKKNNYDTARRFYNYSSEKKSNSDNGAKNNTTKPNFNEQKENSFNKSNTSKSEEKKNGFKFNWEEFISKYKDYTKNYNEYKSETGKTANYGNAIKGKDISTDVEITIDEAINGTTKVINMLHTHVCPKCGGRKFVNGNICPQCKGNGEVSDYKRFSVKIPAGIKNNSKIRLAGEGEKGINNGKNGDLYITVHVKAPIDYKIEGNNILKKIVIAPFEAVLGGKISVKTLDGDVSVKISPNTQNGQKIRLSGCGVNLNGKIGDMILTVEIQIQKNLSKDEIELYKKLQQLSSLNLR